MEREENKEDVLAENTEKKDQFELIYWKLSYRRERILIYDFRSPGLFMEIF